MLFISTVNGACLLLRQHVIPVEENTVNMYCINVTRVSEIIPVQDWLYSPTEIYSHRVRDKVRLACLFLDEQIVQTVTVL